MEISKSVNIETSKKTNKPTRSLNDFKLSYTHRWNSWTPDIYVWKK